MALKEFISTFNRYGVGKKYNFQVTDITNDPAGIFKDHSDLLLYVETLVLPSIKVHTTTVPYKAFDFTVPTNVSFPDSNRWKVTFYSDDNLIIRQLFENWSGFIYDFENNYSNPKNYTKRTDTNKNWGDSILKLQLNNDADQKIKTYSLYGVFPVLIENIEYSISDTGETVAKVPVTLAFQYFTQD